MNKLFTKIAGVALGLTLAIGVGVAVSASVSRKTVPTYATGTDATEYALINSTSDLEAGKSYIITNGTSGTVKTIATTSNTNNRPTTNATVSNGKITRGASVMSVTLGGSSGAWTFYTENYAGTAGYFGQGNQTGSNYLKIYSSVGTGAAGDTWTISFSGDAAVITSTKKTSRNIIRCNSSGTPISCYTSGQDDVYLWKEAVSSCEHTWDSGTVTTAATCTTAGVMTYTCTKCSNTKTEAIAALGHDFGEWTTITAPTCTDTGEEQRVCSRDESHVETRSIDPLGHTFVDGVCSVCGVKEGSELTFSFTSNPGDWPTANGDTLTDYTYTLSSTNYTFKLLNVKQNSGYLMLTKVAVLGLPSFANKKLTKVIAYNSSSCSTSTKVGISDSSSSESYISGGDKQTWSTTSSSYTYDLSDTEENTVYYLYVTSANAQLITLKLNYESVETKTITSSRMVNGTVSASTGDSEWTVSGFQFFVTYEGESETEVTSNTTFAVTESVPTINADGSLSVTVTPTFKGVTYTAKASTVSATLTFIDPYSIARLYDIELALNGTQANLTFDGIYMGYITHVKSDTTYYDLFIGNGDYGMEVYETSTAPSYTIGETYLTVTGTLKNYNYLYEMTSATVTVLTDATRKSHVSAPRTYVVDGTESASTLYLANRKTSLSGTIYSINGNTTAGTKATSGSNNSILVTVGGNNVLLYVKSAQATTEVAAKFAVGDPITVEGFTTYYKSNNVAVFEVLFEEVVEADANYHAADFAKDLLKLTRATCAASDEGNGSALTTIWTTLAGVDHWLKVEAAGEESTFTGGTPDSTIVVPNTDAGIDEMTDADAIAAALYRYDWCTAKYDLTNFIGRSITVSFANSRVSVTPNNNATVIVTVVSILSLTSLGAFFFLKKKKEQ